jgi:hypothetical protein
VQSIFTRPRARPPLAAVSSQQNMLAVTTEDELLAALTALPRSDGACYGRGINIVGDITLTGTVTLGAQHSGLLITSSSNARLSTKTASVTPTFFVQRANDVIIERLVLPSTFLSARFVQTSFSRSTVVRSINVVNASQSFTMMLVGAGSFNASVHDCFASTQISISVSIIEVASGSQWKASGNIDFNGDVQITSTSGVITGNVRLGRILGAAMSQSVISSNTMVGDIQLQSGGARNVISGNVMNGYNINTLSTNGENSIVGNVDVGTITNDPLDAVTSNT